MNVFNRLRNENVARWSVAGLMIVVIVILTSVFVWHQKRVTRAPTLPEPSLKVLAEKHQIEVGNFAIRNYLHDKPYAAILTSQFNLALADNTPNWYFTDGGLRPTRDSYDFKHMDEVINFAQSNNMNIQAHHYVWGEEKWLPDWLKNGNYTKNQLYKLMHDHIQTVGSRYSGRIQEWTVVNEAFNRGQHVYGLHDWWADHTGSKEYIDQAFIWARKADPHSKLILNDFNNETVNDISNEMFVYIKGAKARGIPIDGIGMQMHIDGTHPPVKDEVVSNMKRFGELGVAIYVTELDVNMSGVKAVPANKDKIQADIYREMARACIESKVCHSFSILGVTDKETWYNYMNIADPRPLPFDDLYRPKPAFFSLRDAFNQ